MSKDIWKDIAETRRNMPRNQTVMRICNALEEKLRESKKSLDNHETGFDRLHYQRLYMRAYRATRKKQKAARAALSNEGKPE